MWHANGIYKKKDIIENLYVDFGLTDEEKKSLDLMNNFIGVKPGYVSYYIEKKVPEGWLACFGQKVSKKIYYNLFDAIGYTYDETLVDDDEYFRLPDLRGVFIRGYDNRSENSIDIDRKGKWENAIKLQEDEIKTHKHKSVNSVKHNHKIDNSSHSHDISVNKSSVAGLDTDKISYLNNKTNSVFKTEKSNKDHTHIIKETDPKVIIPYDGKTETRPVNYALLPCIKY